MNNNVSETSGRTPSEAVKIKREFLSSQFLQGWRSVKKGVKVATEINPELAKDRVFKQGRKFATLHPDFNQIRDGHGPFEPAYKVYLEDREAGKLNS